MTIPNVSDIDRIAALSDPVLRNLHITQCYHELSQSMCVSLGGVANWCTFATWASRQAGSTIRGEDVQRVIEQRLAGAPEITDIIRHVVALVRNRHPLDAGQIDQGVRELVLRGPAPRRAAAAVARGNLKVFAEIGREFARLLAELPTPDSRTPHNIEKFLTALRPGDPPAGQQYLRTAFEAYLQAAQTNDVGRQTQLILYANLLIGWHEQTRLQPEILEALDAARAELDNIRPLLNKWLLPSWWRRVRAFIGAPATHQAAARQRG